MRMLFGKEHNRSGSQHSSSHVHINHVNGMHTHQSHAVCTHTLLKHKWYAYTRTDNILNNSTHAYKQKPIQPHTQIQELFNGAQNTQEGAPVKPLNDGYGCFFFFIELRI